jgi:hypothetical protein
MPAAESADTPEPLTPEPAEEADPPEDDDPADEPDPGDDPDPGDETGILDPDVLDKLPDSV